MTSRKGSVHGLPPAASMCTVAGILLALAGGLAHTLHSAHEYSLVPDSCSSLILAQSCKYWDDPLARLGLG